MTYHDSRLTEMMLNRE